MDTVARGCATIFGGQRSVLRVDEVIETRHPSGGWTAIGENTKKAARQHPRYWMRSIPNRLIRNRSVEGFRPRTAAAPLGP